jgi:hypothetical protein
MKRLTYCLALSIAVVMFIGFSIGQVDAACLNPAEDGLLPAFGLAIDNPWLPMVPGTTFVYEAEEEDEFIRNEITITHATTMVMGVTCTVVYDVEWVYIEELDLWFVTEETYDWHAQDIDGNVWYFGEDTQEYLYDDDWNFLGTDDEGSWTAGEDGALPGIVMLADPMPGVCYQQEYYEDEAEDMGKVLRLNAEVSLEELGDFEECLVTKEWTILEPGAIENKYYAYGTGLVFIRELRGKTVHVELVEIISP